MKPMPLIVDLRITSGRGTKSLGKLEISRQGFLNDPSNPDDEVHTYAGFTYRDELRTSDFGVVQHRYGDGAWALVTKMLAEIEKNGRPEWDMVSSRSGSDAGANPVRRPPIESIEI
jgi:hypothetical protein